MGTTCVQNINALLLTHLSTAALHDPYHLAVDATYHLAVDATLSQYDLRVIKVSK